MLGAIDTTPLTRQQKVRLFRYGVCPRMSWPLTVEDLPIYWLEREIQPLATKALKKWAGLARSSNTSILFLPAKRGGLALPSLVDLYKKMQATRMVQLLSSNDPGVRMAAKLHLEEERRIQRRRFKPAQLVEDLMSGGQSQSRPTVSRAAKTMKSTKVQNPRRRGTHFIRLLPVQSLLRCFRCSHIRFLHSTVLYCLGYIARLRFTEGMAAFTNCSSAVLHCGHTLLNFLLSIETHLADAHALRQTVSPTYARAPWIAPLTHIRACAMDRSRKLFRLFSRHISGTQSFRENRHIVVHLLVVHNPLVPLIGHLVACSARTRADRQTDRQNDYCNPRCACAPRVNHC